MAGPSSCSQAAGKPDMPLLSALWSGSFSRSRALSVSLFPRAGVPERAQPSAADKQKDTSEKL